MSDRQAISVRKRIEIRGIVHGVGFRPFVYRLAKRLDLFGWVLNSSDGVVIEAEGAEPDIEHFLPALRTELPPLARIDHLSVFDQALCGGRDFIIELSIAGGGSSAPAPPDIATCADCEADFTSPNNRRFAYPFTNCTNCGPRYTIIRDVPYDRANTTMAEFTMCVRCREEYESPLNRRFHAEPNACPDCGPWLTLFSSQELSTQELSANAASCAGAPQLATGQGNDAVLRRARRLLRDGWILAIKGLGGFHLACDATNERSVNLLRERKRREPQ